MMPINNKFVLIENINVVLNTFLGKRPNQGVVDLASRWLSVFEHHGIRRTQIPRLLPDFPLRLDMLADESTLLELLTDELCTATCGKDVHAAPAQLIGDGLRNMHVHE